MLAPFLYAKGEIMLNARQIREFRERRGLSLRDVSDACGISYGCISGYETGKRRLTKDAYKRIIDGINIAYQKKKETD